MSPSPVSVAVEDLDRTIEEYTSVLGYRLDIIFPADDPREARLSKGDETVMLVRRAAPARPLSGEWTKGRAGMEYRELLPGRLGGKVIASQIRLTKGGEVPDYVHYHKIGFQMIYCTIGRIKVVYEGQGPAFWLETGDCVLQPPEIRHRVLECTAGAEVIEIGMPAEHETWVEHEIELPTPSVNSNREFGMQRFTRHISDAADWKPSSLRGYEERDTGIATATRALADVRVLRRVGDADVPVTDPTRGLLVFPLQNGELLWVFLQRLMLSGN